jgi:hypothetical protein
MCPPDPALLKGLDHGAIGNAQRNSVKMSDDDLTWAVEASATQIALRWIVHQWDSAFDDVGKPLDLQIFDFSAQALGEMCEAYPVLRNATEELRWLTYFNGLMAAKTHPHDQMLTAIDNVRRARTAPIAKPGTGRAAEQRYEDDPASSTDALAAIDRALSNASYSQPVANPYFT